MSLSLFAVLTRGLAGLTLLAGAALSLPNGFGWS